MVVVRLTDVSRGAERNPVFVAIVCGTGQCSQSATTTSTNERWPFLRVDSDWLYLSAVGGANLALSIGTFSSMDSSLRVEVGFNESTVATRIVVGSFTP